MYLHELDCLVDVFLELLARLLVLLLQVLKCWRQLPRFVFPLLDRHDELLKKVDEQHADVFVTSHLSCVIICHDKSQDLYLLSPP